MSFLSRMLYTLISAGIFWGAYYFWDKDQDEKVRAQRLPLVEKALAIEIKQSTPFSVCVNTPRFPYGEGVPRTQWVKLPTGLSECKVIGELKIRGGVANGCKECEDLAALGVLEKADMTFTDYNGQTVTREAYRLTDLGKPLYYADIRERTAAQETGCTPGEVSYVGAEKQESDTEHGNYGFCFADELRFHTILDYQKPKKMGSSILMGVQYDYEAVNPDPLLFDERMGVILDSVPKSGTPALYEPVITTAVFGLNKAEPPMFDPGTRYGDWINKK